MNTSLIIVCLIMVCVIFLPFFLFNRSGKAKQNKAIIKGVISKNNLKISQEETWGNSYIGLDDNQKKLMFLKFLDTNVIELLFDINTIKECTINEQRKFYKVKDKKESLLEKLDFKVSLKSGETIALNFFDTNLNYKEDFELKRIEKWKFLITQLITAKNSDKKVA